MTRLRAPRSLAVRPGRGPLSRSGLAAFATLLVASLGCAPGAARAEHGHPGGHHGSPRNRASFQVEAVREVANDWTMARLSVRAEGKQAATVAASVNAAMAKAVERAKRVAGVDVKSGGYTTQPVYDDGRVVRWRASQDLRLESGDTDALSRLIGDLQSQSVHLVGIQFGVRRETREALENELIEEALSRFRARAELIAKGLGAKDWTLVNVNVGSTQPGVMHVRAEHARSFDMMSKAPSPSFEPGTSEVRVNASGTVEIE